MAGFLLINRHAGRGGAGVDDIAAAARERGIETRVLRSGEDAAAVARRARADVLGIAGGDGSLAPVAAVALERELGFVCIPLGTRNHFARDLGLDRDDPIAALAAFEGQERRVDVGRAGDRIFLNNLSLGAYASLVHRREAHRRRREGLARARALLLTLRHPYRLRIAVDGERVAARVVLVANNAYRLRLFDLGARHSLTEGRLHLYTADGLLPNAWEERSAERFTLAADRVRRAALDGEPLELTGEIECRIEPRGLRVLVPPPSG